MGGNVDLKRNLNCMTACLQMKEQISKLPPLIQYETLQRLKEENKATNRGVFAGKYSSAMILRSKYEVVNGVFVE